MLDITFIKKKRAPNYFKPVTYHVDELNNVIAAVKAKNIFMLEHKYMNYDKIVITETRVI